MTQSTNSLIQGVRLVSKVYFPRIFIPLAPIAAGLVDFVIALSIVGVLMGWYGVAPTTSILFLPVLIAIMVLTSASIGLWFSILAAQYRDVRFAIQFVAQILMYAATVVRPASLIPEIFRIVYGLYPMAGVVEGFRSALLATNPMPWDLIIPGVISAASLFVTGLFYFRRTERILADVV